VFFTRIIFKAFFWGAPSQAAPAVET